MAVTLTVEELAEALGMKPDPAPLPVIPRGANRVDADPPAPPTYSVAERLLAAVRPLVEDYAPEAPEALANEAAIRCAGWLWRQPAPSYRSETIGEYHYETAPSYLSALRHSGGMALLSPYKRRRAGVIG